MSLFTTITPRGRDLGETINHYTVHDKFDSPGAPSVNVSPMQCIIVMNHRG